MLVSSSSGCAAIHSTRMRSTESAIRTPAKTRVDGVPDDGTTRVAASAARATDFCIVSSWCSGFDRHAAPLRTGQLRHRCVHLGDDPLLLLLVRFGVTLGGTRAIGTTDAEGVATLALPSGPHTLRIEPPIDAPYLLVEQPLAVEADRIQGALDHGSVVEVA